MDLGLAGKVALVGGASQGMGKAIARGFAREGAKVSICARGGEGAGARRGRDPPGHGGRGPRHGGGHVELRRHPQLRGPERRSLRTGGRHRQQRRRPSVRRVRRLERGRLDGGVQPEPHGHGAAHARDGAAHEEGGRGAHHQHHLLRHQGAHTRTDPVQHLPHSAWWAGPRRSRASWPRQHPHQHRDARTHRHRAPPQPQRGPGQAAQPAAGRGPGNRARRRSPWADSGSPKEVRTWWSFSAPAAPATSPARRS